MQTDPLNICLKNVRNLAAEYLPQLAVSRTQSANKFSQRVSPAPPVGHSTRKAAPVHNTLSRLLLHPSKPSPPPPQTMPPPPPTLPEELLEEVFLRLPPDEPASLVRASLASKLWLGLLTGAAFHGRYRDFHGAAPMLGFFQSGPHFVSEEDPLFVSTTKFRARVPDDQHWRSYGGDPLDCRHGRVAIGYRDFFLVSLAVLDPMTGRWWDLGAHYNFRSYGAAVLCTVTGCDHRACHDGPLRVVFVGLDKDFHGGTVASVWLHSLGTGGCSSSEPSEVCSVQFEASGLYIEPTCSVLVEDALYFMLVSKDDDDRARILKFDLSSNCLSLIDAPVRKAHTSGATILMAMEDGSLGFAYVDGLTLHLWSRQLGSDGVASWTDCKVINLKELLPILNPENGLTLIGSVAGRDIIFVNTDFGICEINLKTLQWKKIWKREKIRTLVPYMSFYNPEEL